MHIVNVMFSKGLGGIEQALVDYCEALKMEGHKVTALIYPRAQIKSALLPLGVNIIEVKNFAGWDFLSRAYIKKVFGQLAPDAVIAHGNRAVSLVGRESFIVRRNDKPQTTNHKLPIIGVTHNYSIKHLIGLDAIFATTNDLRAKVIEAGQPADMVFKVPNMVRIDKGLGIMALERKNLAPSPQPPAPIIIGTMGRFVKKKGFDVFIYALAHLKEQGVDFKAVIGGGGEEEDNLKKLAAELGLSKAADCGGDSQRTINGQIPTTNDLLTFLGWVENKQQFFDNIDIFVLPSLHEPFGIILLEAFAHGKPVVVADSEGPSEIAENNIDAIIVKKGDYKALAEGIVKLVNDQALASKIAQNGFAKAARYDIKPFAASLNEAVIKVKNGIGHE